VTENDGELYEYMHLSEIADLKRGQRLREGDLIGFVGDTGNAREGPAHLHFEIRVNGKAYDPYDRINLEYSLEDKIEFLDDILDEYDDARELAEFLVDTYEYTFVLAQTKGIDLPRRIERLLDEPVDIAARTTKDMEVGDEGRAVSALQATLIDEGHLNISEPTGYFGPKTKAALREYQEDMGVSPATGYFGPLTRKAMRGDTSSTVASTKMATTHSTDSSELKDLVRLLIAMGVIAKDKEQTAYDAIATL